MYASIADLLEVGRRIRPSSWIVVLLKVGLEGSASRRVRLVTKRCTSVSDQVFIVIGHMVLATPHAPADDGNTTQKDGTTHAADYTSDDFLVAAAEAAAATIPVFLREGKFSRHSGASSDDVRGLTSRRHCKVLPITNGRINSGEDTDGGRNERRGFDNGSGH